MLTSGYNIHELSQGFVASGLAGFLQKPYRRAELLDKIGEALGARAA